MLTPFKLTTIIRSFKFLILSYLTHYFIKKWRKEKSVERLDEVKGSVKGGGRWG